MYTATFKIQVLKYMTKQNAKKSVENVKMIEFHYHIWNRHGIALELKCTCHIPPGNYWDWVQECRKMPEKPVLCEQIAEYPRANIKYTLQACEMEKPTKVYLTGLQGDE